LKQIRHENFAESNTRELVLQWITEAQNNLFFPLEERDHVGKTYQLKWTILENMKVYVVTNSSNNEAF